MNKLINLLVWAAGLIIGFLAVAVCFYSLGAGLFVLGVSLLILPPARRKVFELTGRSLAPRARGMLMLALLMTAGVLVSVDRQEAERLAKAEKLVSDQRAEEQANTANTLVYFERKQEILQAVRDAIADRQYRRAIEISEPFLVTLDVDISDLHKKAVLLQKALDDEARKFQLVAEIKALAEDNHEARRFLYQELMALDPKREAWRVKRDFHLDKALSQELEKSRALRISRQFSPRDGAHIPLMLGLQEQLHDPESFEHISTTYTDQGTHLLVTMNYRAKNGFGATRLYSITAKVGVGGELLAIVSTS